MHVEYEESITFQLAKDYLDDIYNFFMHMYSGYTHDRYFLMIGRRSNVYLFQDSTFRVVKH